MPALLDVRPKALVLLPAWRERNADEEAWVSALLRQLGRSLGATIVNDPGFTGEHRGGLRFSHRHWRDFREQCKEAIFENPIEVIVVIGEAAKAENLDALSGWAPNIPRVALFLESDLSGPRPLRLKSISDCSDLVLYRGDWKSGGERESCIGFIREPTDVLSAIHARFSLQWLHTGAPEPKDPPTIDIFTRRGTEERARVKRLVGGLGSAARARHVELSGFRQANGGAAFWNAAFRSSRADYLVFLNELFWLPDKALARMLEYFKMGSALGVIGAAGREAADLKEVRRLASLHHMSGGHRECGRFLHAHCWMLSRQALRQTGFLDERFRCRRFALYDYGFRLRQAGFRLFTATDIAAWRIGKKAGEAKEPSSSAERDLKLLEKKWCENGIGAILRLSRRTQGGRKAAVGRANEKDSAAPGAWVRQHALFGDNSMAARHEWSDYAGMSAELKNLMNQSRRESEHLNADFRRAIDDRHDRLSREIRKAIDERHGQITRDIWSAAESLRAQSQRMQHDMERSIRPELAGVLYQLQKQESEIRAWERDNSARVTDLREDMDDRYDKLGRDFRRITAQMSKQLSSMAGSFLASMLTLQQKPVPFLKNGTKKWETIVEKTVKRAPPDFPKAK